MKTLKEKLYLLVKYLKGFFLRITNKIRSCQLPSILLSIHCTEYPNKCNKIKTNKQKEEGKKEIKKKRHEDWKK